MLSRRRWQLNEPQNKHFFSAVEIIFAQTSLVRHGTSHFRPGSVTVLKT
jgi:hypothetical protein